MTLKVVARARRVTRNAHIPAMTAMGSIHPEGRERALQCGANILMPNITPASYRKRYQLYEGKPCLEEEPTACGGCLTHRLRAVGETVALGQWGDSPHFKRRTKGNS